MTVLPGKRQAPALRRAPARPPWWALLLLVWGCNNAPTDGTIREVSDFPRGGMTPGGSWESAPPPSEQVCKSGDPEEDDLSWVELKPGDVREFQHGLGRTPSLIMPYIAFEQTGCRVSTGTGDLARIEFADDNAVQIRNRTEQKFYLRLVLL